MEASTPRVLVVGCGGIGGTVAAHLTHLGVDVTPLTRNESIAEAINQRGLTTKGELNVGTVKAVAVTSLDDLKQPFDIIILATQPPQVEDAARSVASLLKPDGVMVTLQNGLCELRIAPIVGSDRVVGGVVAWGASMVAPGIYDRTSGGGFVLGTLSPKAMPQCERLATLFEAIGPVTITDNLMGARWSKLAINCCISTLGTIGGERLGILMRKRFVRRLGLEIMTEAVEVARAHDIQLEKVAGTLDLDWIALSTSEREAQLGSPGLLAKHGLLLAVGMRYRRLRSSMLNAIERGRPPAIDFLNGEVVERAEAHGVATPVNAAAQELVHAIASGTAKSSVDTLRSLFDQTR